MWRSQGGRREGLLQAVQQRCVRLEKQCLYHLYGRAKFAVQLLLSTCVRTAGGMRLRDHHTGEPGHSLSASTSTQRLDFLYLSVQR